MKYAESVSDINVFYNFLKGARTAIPIMLGYFPAGFAFGVLAREAGLSVIEVALMSFFVYTGTSQFITVAQMAGGVSLGVIIVTCAIVNMRYMLMSASIASKFSALPVFQKILFGAHLTDETFLVNSSRSEQHTAEELASTPLIAETLGVNVLSHFSWVSACTSGCYFGGMLGDVKRLGIDFGLVGIFLALLAPRLKDRTERCVMFSSAALALVLFLLGFGTWSVIIATVFGATLGLKIS